MLTAMATRDILVILFLGVSVLSGITVAFATRNYLEFFPAMEQVTVRVASTEAQIVEQVYTVVVRFILENPTGYSGLSVRYFHTSVSFQELDGTVVPYGTPKAPLGLRIPVAPNSRLDFVTEIPLQGLWQPIGESFVNGTLLALLRVSVTMSTFLDSLSWITLNYECVLGFAAERPLNCERGPTTAISPRGGGGGA